MDPRNSVLSSVTIQNGRFDFSGGKLGPCTKTINLHGRTAVPGLIDNHNHILLLGLRPGYDTRLETAASIKDVQAAIAERAKSVPAGKFITAMGGWNPAQFAEKRLPTLAELDSAAPGHPVLVFLSFTGPAATNSLGKAFFTEKGIDVSATGAITANAASLAALNALRSVQTFEDQKRGTADALAYSASVGITTDVDMGAFVKPGVDDIQDSFTFDGLATADPFHMYDASLALHREKKLAARLRIFFLSMDTQPAVPLLRERLLNSFDGFGDDMLKFNGIGERVTWAMNNNDHPTADDKEKYYQIVRWAAQRGMPVTMHWPNDASADALLSIYERVNGEIPIKDLRWSVAHLTSASPENLRRMKAMGVGWTIQRPNAASVENAKELGVNMGAGTDAHRVASYNPFTTLTWLMVDSKNAGSVLRSPEQTPTREDALRAYTIGSAWFSFDENKRGSLEPGKLADLAVLTKDYITVPLDQIGGIESLLTMVGGKIVYASGPYARLNQNSQESNH